MPAQEPTDDSFVNDFDPFQANSFHELLRALDASKTLAGDAEKKRQHFVKDVSHLRHRMIKGRRGLINPRSRRVQYWDFITCLALIFTATVTPFEVGMGLPTTVNSLYVINTVVNVIFTIDIVIQVCGRRSSRPGLSASQPLLPSAPLPTARPLSQFFMPVPALDGSGDFIRSHKLIAKRYLTTWFVLDVVTVLPFDTISVVAPDMLGVTECDSPPAISPTPCAPARARLPVLTLGARTYYLLAGDALRRIRAC
jgi:hypothetical protein